MHYSPKCFISPFPTFLELGTAPASRHAREGRRKEAFRPVYYRSSPSQVRKTLSAPIFAPSSKKKNNVPRVIPWILSIGLETRKFEVYAEAKLPSLGVEDLAPRSNKDHLSSPPSSSLSLAEPSSRFIGFRFFRSSLALRQM